MVVRVSAVRRVGDDIGRFERVRGQVVQLVGTVQGGDVLPLGPLPRRALV